MNSISASRRKFLRFLAGSPVLAQAWAQQSGAPAKASEILAVMDLEEIAHQALPPAHWGYLSSAVDDDNSLRVNREGFKHFQLRPNRLVDVSKASMKTEIFGTVWDAPIFLCPVGGQRMFHPDGELAVARAAKAKSAVQILSSMTSIAVEDVAKAKGSAPWYQLYIPARPEGVEKLVKRVEDAGCPVLAWTVDILGGRNLETAERLRRKDTRDCTACHATARGGRAAGDTPMYQGIAGGMNPQSATWETVDKLKKMTKMKIMLKGLETGGDAKRAVEHGADGIVVSNHGGRSLDTGRSTIESLGEVVDAVGGRIPVFVDGGFRRGTDIYKALALGATAVGVGRPYIWGLTAFGEEGVSRVVDILRAELALTMRQCGTPTIKQITRSAVVTAG